jgi:hypothetical protein
MPYVPDADRKPLPDPRTKEFGELVALTAKEFCAYDGAGIRYAIFAYLDRADWKIGDDYYYDPGYSAATQNLVEYVLAHVVEQNHLLFMRWPGEEED